MGRVQQISDCRSIGTLGAVLCMVISCGSDSSSGAADGASGGTAPAGASGGAAASGGALMGTGGTPSALGAGGTSQGGNFSGGAPGSGGSVPPGGMTGLGGAGGDLTGAGGDTTGAGGDLTGAGGDATGAGGAPPSGDFCLQAGSGDYSQDGPYQVATEDVTIGSSGAYTIWYPTQLESNCKHPMVAWGNGTTVTGSGTYAFLNNRAASWGIVAIGSHNSNVGNGSFHRAALDYLLEQNQTASSKFYEKLSGRAGVSGHSQGGLGASAASSHPSVEALVPIGAAGAAGSLAYMCFTGTADLEFALSGCRSSINSAQGPALGGVWEGGDHVSTQTIAGWLGRDPGTIQLTRLYAAWFRCFLADDATACGLFTGGNPSCTICTDPGWNEVLTKNL